MSKNKSYLMYILLVGLFDLPLEKSEKRTLGGKIYSAFLNVIKTSVIIRNSSIIRVFFVLFLILLFVLL